MCAPVDVDADGGTIVRRAVARRPWSAGCRGQQQPRPASATPRFHGRQSLDDDATDSLDAAINAQQTRAARIRARCPAGPQPPAPRAMRPCSASSRRSSDGGAAVRGCIGSSPWQPSIGGGSHSSYSAIGHTCPQARVELADIGFVPSTGSRGLSSGSSTPYHFAQPTEAEEQAAHAVEFAAAAISAAAAGAGSTDGCSDAQIMVQHTAQTSHVAHTSGMLGEHVAEVARALSAQPQRTAVPEQRIRRQLTICPHMRARGMCGLPSCPFIHEVCRSHREHQPLGASNPIYNAAAPNNCGAVFCRFEAVLGVGRCPHGDACVYTHAEGDPVIRVTPACLVAGRRFRHASTPRIIDAKTSAMSVIRAKDGAGAGESSAASDTPGGACRPPRPASAGPAASGRGAPEPRELQRRPSNEFASAARVRIHAR